MFFSIAFFANFSATSFESSVLFTLFADFMSFSLDEAPVTPSLYPLAPRSFNSSSTDYELLGEYTKHQSLHISKEEWHQLANDTNKPVKIVEIQYGINCVEEDIERKL